MARKRFIFHVTVESLLKKAHLIISNRAFRWRWHHRLLVLLLLSMFLSVGISPVLSQLPVVNPIVQELPDALKLIQEGKKYYEDGLFSQAEESLLKGVRLLEANKSQQSNLAIALSNLSLTYQQQGKLQLAEQAIETSLQILNIDKNVNESSKQKNIAKILNIKGRLQLAQGKPKEALESWQQATGIYEILGDNYEGLIASQINQVIALQALGLYEQAKTAIEQVEKNIETLPDTFKTKTLRSLGDVLRSDGDLDKSQEKLNKSLKFAQSPQDKNATLLSLGNTLWAKGNLERDRVATANYEYIPWRCEDREIPKQAVTFYNSANETYQNVVDNSSFSTAQIKTKLNRLRLLIELRQWTEAQALVSEIQFKDFPKSRSKVYAQINFAKSLACLQQRTSNNSLKWSDIIQWLQTAIQDAENLKDNRAKSYALGNLGGLYEYFSWQDEQLQQNKKAQEWRQKAEQLTQEALFLTQPIAAPDIAYQWQWQLGRLFAAQGEKKREDAIAAYEDAAKTLESARSDLLSINSDVQFSFRDNVEPVYRELVALLLPNGRPNTNPNNLQKAIRQIDNLQLAELQNFLRCKLDIKSVQLDKNATLEDPNAAVFYPIILADRLEVILNLPNHSELIRYNVPIKRIELENTLKELRLKLTNRVSGRDEYEPLSLQVYQWLIGDAEKYLNPDKIKTLVFVLDGSLRNIPMSALWDGKKFLIEKYAIAMTPGLQLLVPKRSERKQLKALIAGLTTGGTVTIKGQTFPFDSLPNVKSEAERINNIFPNSVQLLDNQFKTENLRTQLNSSSYPIIHMATHGNFSSNPQETFILTTSNRHININDLQNLLKAGKEKKPDSIELLVFSACETATGDRRATLGMAGVAIRAGANSTIATLWSVADKSTACLVEQFYRNLQQEIEQKKVTKAEAIRKAQLDLLHNSQLPCLRDQDYTHPYYWSPFVLIGSWL